MTSILVILRKETRPDDDDDDIGHTVVTYSRSAHADFGSSSKSIYFLC